MKIEDLISDSITGGKNARNLVKYLETHPREYLTTAQMAKAIGLSLSHFQTTATAPQVQQYRRIMLRNGNKRVVWASPKAWKAFDQMTLGKNAK